MKIGVKTWDNPEFLKHFENKVDFFEVQAIRKNDYSFLKNFSLPIVIHAEHQNFGVNIANKDKWYESFEAVNFAKKIADFCDSKKIIVHPSSHLEGDFIEHSIDFLKKNFDDRILIENLPAYVGNSPEDIREIMNKSGVGFCFDVNHSLGYPKKSKKEDIKKIREFLRLGPRHFHIGGQRILRNKILTHLSLKNFDFDWKEILKLYPCNAWITLEVTTDVKDVEGDIEYIRDIIN